MSVFQILNQKVLIIQDNKQYTDTTENFLKDSGLTTVPESVIYDDDQQCCVVDQAFLPFPDSTYQGYISKLDDYLAAKTKREYVAPATPTAEEQKVSLKADYDAAVAELNGSMAVAILSGDTEAQESIRSDFKDLQTQYKEALANV